eukprot:TRINITY_DN314_c0_g5_i1.p1 TRINITY_DN314_c0_g5~~TRINITY_DN314_c0_g5_i1.p1  ORF type:complete len:486 (+),score=106.04 TRINITY_DN314_c0_g5_i1:111-1568(+)
MSDDEKKPILGEKKDHNAGLPQVAAEGSVQYTKEDSVLAGPIPLEEKKPFRFTVLLFACLLTFGMYYCYDMPSSLQTTIQEKMKINRFEYNLLYFSYSFVNMLFVSFAGIIADRIGNPRAGYIFSFFILLGQTLFAIGGTIRSFPVMITGRVIFGLGGGSSNVVQNAITSHYFTGRELALAFSIVLTVSRMGTVLNFLFTADINERYGFDYALWLGTVFCALSCIAAAIYGFLDRKNDRSWVAAEAAGTIDGPRKKESRAVRFKDIKKFEFRYWTLDVICLLFYDLIFPFVAVASNYFQTKKCWNYSQKEGGYLAGMVYFIALVLSPILGAIIDRIGFRAVLLALACLFSIPVHLILAFTCVNPIWPLILLGITYSIMLATLWPSVSLIVKSFSVATALGVMVMMQMLGTAISNIVVGVLSEYYSYQDAMIYISANAVAATFVSVILNISDVRRGGILNSKKRKGADEMYEPVSSVPDIDETHED